MICSGLKIVVPLLWSNVVERTLACIYQNWQPSAMTLLTTTSVGRNRNSSEGSLRSPSSKRSWTSVGRNRNSSEGSLRSPSSLKSEEWLPKEGWRDRTGTTSHQRKPFSNYEPLFFLLLLSGIYVMLCLFAANVRWKWIHLLNPLYFWQKRICHLNICHQ